MKKYRYLLFDLDGTLADTDPMIAATMNELYDKYRDGKRTPIEEIYYFSGPPISETLKKEFPDGDQDELYKAFHNISYKYYQTHIFLYPNEKEVLKYLKSKGYKLAIITNKKHSLSEYALDILGIREYFDLIIACDDVKEHKPHPEGVYKALKALKCANLKEALYIGDNRSDYLTAYNAKMDCVLVKWGPRKIDKTIKPTRFITSYLDLKEWLDG